MKSAVKSAKKAPSPSPPPSRRGRKGMWLQMPEPFLDRLHRCAKLVTKHDPLGLKVPARALALRYLSEGMDRTEALETLKTKRETLTAAAASI